MALLGALVLSPLCGLAADADAPKKYALLVAVTKYEHAEMNRPQPLEFPEADAAALAAVLRTADLPERTAALFSCSSGEKAFEDSTSRHGVFTKALLDRIARHSGAEPLTAAVLGEDLEEGVPQGRGRQTVSGTADWDGRLSGYEVFPVPEC